MTRTSGRSAITLVSLCVLSHAIAMTTGILHAQESSRLRSGDRVRVTVPGASPTTRVATLLAVRRDSLLLQTDQPLQQFAVANAPPVLLEVSQNPGAPRGGGLVGGFAGFVVGGLVAQLRSPASWWVVGEHVNNGMRSPCPRPSSTSRNSSAPQGSRIDFD